ncbi:MAG: hypothetical protein CFE21_13895 [Bacteroidetes bacterium B1(2017)]|nr:MAG: hypothetical protein CFE21_13895 [Bacteroidetes bacterium B1(2017)]
MKRKLLFPFFALFLSLASQNIFAQNQTSVGAFMAMPVGKFKSTDLKEGGFAKNGWGIVLDTKSPLKNFPKGLSFYSHSTFQWNAMDTKTMEEKFTKELGYRTEISDSKYSPILTTVGPSYDFPVSDKVSFGVNGTAGIIFNNTKAFSVTVYDNNNVVLVKELFNFDGNIAFAYSFGAQVKFVVIPDVFAISLYGDYTGAKQKTDISSQSSSTEAFQSLNYLNFGVKLVMTKPAGS